ncbi:hypothetical protein ACOMHN_026760 [Nucella lapillus]
MAYFGQFTVMSWPFRPVDRHVMAYFGQFTVMAWPTSASSQSCHGLLLLRPVHSHVMAYSYFGQFTVMSWPTPTSASSQSCHGLLRPVHRHGMAYFGQFTVMAWPTSASSQSWHGLLRPVHSHGTAYFGQFTVCCHSSPGHHRDILPGRNRGSTTDGVKNVLVYTVGLPPPRRADTIDRSMAFGIISCSGIERPSRGPPSAPHPATSRPGLH